LYARNLALPLLSLVVLCCACGGTDAVSSGTASAAGTFGGTTFNVTSAFSTVVTGSKGGAGWVVLTNDANLCGELGASKVSKGMQWIELSLFTADSAKQSHAATATGDYSLDPAAASGLYATFDYYSEDASCHFDTTRAHGGASGLVHVTAIQAGVYTGTFAVKLGTGEQVTGSFGPVACAAAQVLYSTDADTLTCQ
jgi:hypothetical protein